MRHDQPGKGPIKGLHRECEIFLMNESSNDRSPSDGEVEEEVHHGDDDQRHQQHHDRVGREDVVPGVAVVCPHLGRTYLPTCDYEISVKCNFLQPTTSKLCKLGYMTWYILVVLLFYVNIWICLVHFTYTRILPLSVRAKIFFVLHYLTHEFKEKIEVLFREYLYIDMLWKWNIL